MNKTFIKSQDHDCLTRAFSTVGNTERFARIDESPTIDKGAAIQACTGWLIYDGAQPQTGGSQALAFYGKFMIFQFLSKRDLMSDKGAHFFRSDLQVHTPRDINWTGGVHVTDDERRHYAGELVQACRERGLRAIAITDHHDMTFVPFVRRAAAAETDADGKELLEAEKLVVFPGMELTLAVPCQALLI